MGITNDGSVPVSALSVASAVGKEAGAVIGLPAPKVTDQAISGVVTDEKGETLPGVSGLVKGTQRGTTTDVNGTYRLAVPDNSAVLVFSYVGYLSQEAAVGTKSAINIILQTDNKTLNEVVVTGYGAQAKRDITGAVAIVDVKEVLKVPIGRRLDGESVASLLTKKGFTGVHKPIYYVNNGIPEVVKQGEWKLRRTKKADQITIELYNLAMDQSEQTNVATDYPDLVTKMMALLDQYPDRKVSNASRRVLNVPLNELEQHGLIGKTIYPQLPPKVEYYLTDFGRSLMPVIDAMTQWGDDHREQ